MGPAEDVVPSDSQLLQFNFRNSYVQLPERFYARQEPAPVASPGLIAINAALAESLGLDPAMLANANGIEVLAGSRIANGSEPLAQAYAGHQFGHFVPQLGDGRAILLGELVAQNGKHYDLQLKGAGRTPFSRAGDGRAALGPVLREYLVSEAMAALGVPTTRALAAISTGEPVYRETVQPGAILVRLASSHLRVGTFQFFAARNDVEGVKILADYAVARHYPEAASVDKPYRALLEGIVARQAALVAQWMLLGFIHGVMNTDNTTISGETIDYGPCAFLEAYDPNKVFSSIDRQGRYAYRNQPHAMHWNLARFAETLLPLLSQEEGSEEAALSTAYEVLSKFGPQYESAYLGGLRKKLGLSVEADSDLALAEDLLERMAANEADFTRTFRLLSDAAADVGCDSAIRALFAQPAAYDAWAVQWRHRMSSEATSPAERTRGMRRINPAFIPRNHLVQSMIDAAVQREDFSSFHELLKVLKQPYDDQPGMEQYAMPARPEECVHATFCGT